MINSSPKIDLLWVRELLQFLLFCLGGALVGSLLMSLTGKLLGIENIAAAATALNADSTAADRNLVRFFLMLNHASIFALPCLAYGFWRYRSGIASGLALQQRPTLRPLLYAIAIILAVLPLVAFSMWLNEQVPLSQKMLDLEARAADMTKQLLIMNSSTELIITLLAVAVTPAIGEELMFRGVLQPLFERFFKNGHLAVWFTAILFSAIHFQMQGFLPRLLLGAVLGYFMYFSRNLWLPIIAHFIFNGGQVIAQFAGKIDLESSVVTFKSIALPSIASLFLVLFLFSNFRKSQEPSSFT